MCACQEVVDLVKDKRTWTKIVLMFKKGQKGYQQRMADQDANRQVPREDMSQILRNLERVTGRVRETVQPVQPPDRVEELKEYIKQENKKLKSDVKYDIKQLSNDWYVHIVKVFRSALCVMLLFLILAEYVFTPYNHKNLVKNDLEGSYWYKGISFLAGSCSREL